MEEEACYTRELLNRVTGGWAPLILRSLGQGELRFSQIERAVSDISRRMLAKTLRILEEDGLVIRTVHPTKPASVSYRLSQLGAELLPLLEAIAAWGQVNEEKIKAARRSYR